VTETVLDAAELGLDRAKPDDLRGGDAAFNAEVARRLFAGEHGPVRDAVLVNTAAALAAQSTAGPDVISALHAGLDRAAAAIDSGAAARLLDQWVAVASQAAAAE
jgi:anthranilate phosphoribosyltransferase